MASLGHVVVGVTAARAAGLNTKGMVLCGALSLLPDLDVLGLALHVPYGSSLGHRGATHSIAFAVLVSLIAAVLAHSQRQSATRWGLAVLVAVLSHPFLDALTDGGMGVAVFWPLSSDRYFLPWTPLPVPPLGIGMLSARGRYVLIVELLVFAPLVAYALWPRRAARVEPSTRT